MLILHVLGGNGQFAKSLRRGLFGAALALAWPGVGLADSAPDVLRARVAALGGEGGNPVVAQFYGQRQYRPAWDQRDRREALVALVRGLPGHGLPTADFPLETLGRAAVETGGGAEAVAEREVLFTAGLARLARYLALGKVDPRRLYPEWNFAPALGPEEAARQLEALLQAPALGPAVEGLAPSQPEYQGLRTALERYRQLAAGGGWSPVPSGPSLKLGMVDPRVAALRARLQAEGEALAVAPGAATTYDAGLQTAVARFQARHGVEPDGAVGKRTLAELNVPAAGRVDQIRVNLERLRWVARDRVGDHLMVDIPGYAARLYLGGQRVWDSKVVVGRPFRKTPAFRADLAYLVLNPRWVVPPTILREDVLPKLASDPGYLAAHEMTVVDGAGHPVEAAAIDWQHYRGGGFPYQIVQVPGPENPLGQIKFMLPNPHAIYLHDTPSRRLFQRTERAQSSGCVRLEKPLDLAVLLLNDPARWSREALEAELATGTTRSVTVKRRVPTLVLYFTAEADGEVRFRPDLYGRDGAVLAGLDRPGRF